MSSASPEMVDPGAVLGAHDAARKTEATLLGMLDVPAYIRRALDVEEARDRLMTRCRAQREEWLAGVRWRLAAWRRRELESPELVARWGERARRSITELCQQVFPDRDASKPIVGTGRIDALWRDLVMSVERFNRRWLAFLDSVDVAEVNHRIRGYNQYYVFEKECALRSARLATLNFRTLDPVTPETLRQAFPPLIVPNR